MGLPDKTHVHLPDERLANNVDTYDLPRRMSSLTQGELAAVALIKSNLLAIPLTHGTKSPARDLLQHGIIPSGHPDNPVSKNNTYKLDCSLGLDEFTFMHWGAVAHNPYGKTIARIDTRAIIESPQTIVTQQDITSNIFFGRRKTYDTLPPHKQRNIQEYFDTAVTGRDWLDITALGALHFMQRHKRPTYRLDTHDELGEIKYAGIITTDMITDILDDDASKLRAQREMLGHGFAPVSKQSLPAARSIATWQEILEEANRSQN